MIVHTQKINYKYGDTIKIKVLADWHVGNAHCDEKCIKKYLEDSDDKTYFIGLGDLMDCIITSDLKRYRKSSDGTEGDEIIDKQVDKVSSWLEPYKENIIILGTGNHEDNITKRTGSNPSKRLCEKLNCKYGGYSYLLKLVFSESGNRGRTVVIRAHHGWGGGSRTTGGEITKYSKDVNSWIADLHVYGHGHKLQSDRMVRLGLFGDKLKAKSKHIVLCGSFLKTFSDDENPTYSEIAGYPPIEMGAPNINITPDSTWVKIKVDL